MFKLFISVACDYAVKNRRIAEKSSPFHIIGGGNEGKNSCFRHL